MGAVEASAAPSIAPCPTPLSHAPAQSRAHPTQRPPRLAQTSSSCSTCPSLQLTGSEDEYVSHESHVPGVLQYAQ